MGRLDNEKGDERPGRHSINSLSRLSSLCMICDYRREDARMSDIRLVVRSVKALKGSLSLGLFHRDLAILTSCLFVECLLRSKCNLFFTDLR